MKSVFNKDIPSAPDHSLSNRPKWIRFLFLQKDLFANFPTKLYHAWMAENQGPGYKSFLINDPKCQRAVLQASPMDYPKSPIVYSGMGDLLGGGIFDSSGERWKKLREFINPVFEGGRLNESFPHFQTAAQNLTTRFEKIATKAPENIEYECSYYAADLIFRTMFSTPLSEIQAQTIFDAFQNYQSTQPAWNHASIMKMPSWVPRPGRRKANANAALIREGLAQMVSQRLEDRKTHKYDDFVERLLERYEAEGEEIDHNEMVNYLAIFMLAGHDTSAAALSWALYLLAYDQDYQARVYEEVKDLDLENASIQNFYHLPQTRNTFHETLRLYAPVPILVREATKATEFRERKVKAKDLCIVSPWYSGRHERIWEKPHEFYPDRWNNISQECKHAYFPFSAGGRKCIGAGFALIEGILGISYLVKNFHFALSEHRPIPVAHLTTRSKDGIYLKITKR